MRVECIGGLLPSAIILGQELLPGNDSSIDFDCQTAWSHHKCPSKTPTSLHLDVEPASEGAGPRCSGPTCKRALFWLHHTIRQLLLSYPLMILVQIHQVDQLRRELDTTNGPNSSRANVKLPFTTGTQYARTLCPDYCLLQFASSFHHVHW